MLKDLKKKLPPVTSLVAFEAAGRLGSFASAAIELNVSREAVSRQIRMLEEYLGVLLFVRDANSVKIGPIGEQFFQIVSPNLWAIANATSELSSEVVEETSEPLPQDAFDEEERPTLLILDDTPENIHQLNGILGSEYNVAGFTAVKDALQYLLSNSADLVLLDVRMPEMDGLDVARNIRSTAALKDIPIIFVTNLDSHDDEVQALDAGGSDFISRPIVPAILKARIKTHIELLHSRHAIEQLLSRRVHKLTRAEELIRALGDQINEFQRD